MTHTESVALDSALLVESSATAPPTAAERLQASREALQAWIRATYHPQQADTRAPHHQADDTRDPGWLGMLADSISDVPMATVAVRWLKRWWARHPLRSTAEFAGVAAEELIGPAARKHPWLVLAAAAAAGALAARLRPWRWVSKDAVVSSLLPTVSVASILHWVTNSLHSLHPRSDPGTSAPPATDTAADTVATPDPQTPVQPAPSTTPPAAATTPPYTGRPLQAEPALH